jgi:uncharacterized protein YuzE
MMQFNYDADVDAVYVELRNEPYAYGKDLDDSRRVDYGRDDVPVGIELLNVSLGVNVDDPPERAAVGRLLKEHNLKVYA